MKDKPISFSTQNTEFIIELRNKVNNYFETANVSKFGNINIILKSLFMLSLYAGPYFLMVFGVIQSLPLIILSWLIMGMGMAGLGMVIMHDSNHSSLSKNHKINRLFGKSLYLLGGFPPTWRHQHNTMHHGYTNIDGYDEDINPLGILRFSPHKKRRKIHRYQHLFAWFFYGLMTFSWVTMKDFKQLNHYRKKGVNLSSANNYNLLFADLIASKIIYYIVFLVIPIMYIPVPWYTTILLFLLMHFVSGLILGVVFQAAHVVPDSSYPLPDSEGNIENNWGAHQLMTTSDFAPQNKLLSWLLGGLNHQVEHHLFPNISHVHYRKISPIVKETARKYNLPYHFQSSMLKGVRSHYTMLKKLGRKDKPNEFV